MLTTIIKKLMTAVTTVVFVIGKPEMLKIGSGAIDITKSCIPIGAKII